MSKIIIFLPVFIALMGDSFSKGTLLFISNFQINHPIIYIIISSIIIIAYIVLLSSLFNIKIESYNKYLYIISIPIVFYLLSNLLNIEPPSFIVNFADSHTMIFSILVGIITAFYLLFIIIAAIMVIKNKDYSSSINVFVLIPAAVILLLYIFDIGIPTFIINFYKNHKVWFYIVFSITALTYIIVLFNLLSIYMQGAYVFNSHGKTVLVFIIIFAVLTFIFRDNILFFNTNKNDASAVRIEETIKDNKENTENIGEDIVKAISGVITLFIIILFLIKDKFMPYNEISSIGINSINTKGVKLKVNLEVINRKLPLTIKLDKISISLYKNNKRIGSSFTECSKELKFREYNTLELYVTVYFLDAFKSIIPYLTEEFSCKACVYVTFRISFIPITFLTKIIKNI